MKDRHDSLFPKVFITRETFVMTGPDFNNVIPLPRASHGAQRVRGTGQGDAERLYVPVTRKVSLTDEKKHSLAKV